MWCHCCYCCFDDSDGDVLIIFDAVGDNGDEYGEHYGIRDYQFRLKMP